MIGGIDGGIGWGLRSRQQIGEALDLMIRTVIWAPAVLVIATIVPKIFSLYVRKTFNIADKIAISKASLHVDYDDKIFNAKNLSSGVYFYCIKAVSKTRAYTDVKKMIYLK